MYKIIHIHPENYSAIIENAGEIYRLSPPYIKKKTVSNNLLESGLLSQSSAIKKFKTADGARDYLLMQFYFLLTNNLYGNFKKINEGSLDIKSLEELEEKVIQKVDVMSYLKSDNPQLLRSFLVNYWFLFGATSNSVEFAKEFFYDSKIETLIQNDIELFSVWKVDKVALIDEISTQFLPRMKKEKKWKAFKNSTFTLFLAGKLLGYKNVDALQATYKEATEEFEINTGLDANHSSFQRHTDRRSRHNYKDIHWKKYKNKKEK